MKDNKGQASGVIIPFYNRIWEDTNSPRAQAILEYFNGVIFSQTYQDKVFNNDPTSHLASFNKFYWQSRSQNEIFQTPGLKTFDPYVMDCIRQAVENGTIDRNSLGKFEYLVDIVDIAEKQIEKLNQKGKTLSEKNIKSILNKSINAAMQRRIKEESVPQIQNEQSLANSQQEMQNYISKIPQNVIAENSPETDINNLDLRGYQMIILFNAYQNGRTQGNFGRQINEKDNRLDVMKYVLSQDGRFESPDNILTKDDISAVAKVSQVYKNTNKQPEMKNVLNMANYLIGIANVVREDYGDNTLRFSQIITSEVADNVVKDIISEGTKQQKWMGKESFAQLAIGQKMSVLQKAKDLISKTLENIKNKGISQNIEF